MTPGFWLFERPFSFESRDSIQDVVQALRMLKDVDVFGNSPDEVSIEPMADGYAFRYVVRRTFRWQTYATAFGEGQVWEDDDGVVIVEGMAQINPWGLYGSLFLAAILGWWNIATRDATKSIAPSVWLILLAGWAVFWMLLYIEDRNRVVNLLAQALDLDSTFDA